MRIAYIIYDMSTQGGMERVTSLKASWLVNHGHSVDIIAVEQTHRESYFELDQKVGFIGLGIKILNNSKKNIFSRIFRRVFVLRPKYRKAIKETLYSGRYDICVSLVPFDHSSICSFKDGSKKIFETHFSYKDPFVWVFPKYPPVIKQLAMWDYKVNCRKMNLYDKCVTLTEEDAQHRGLDNTISIPNPNSFVCEKSADISSKNAIALGRYVPQKAFDNLVEAWRLVAKKHSDWTLYIYGKKDSEWEKVENLIKNYGLEQNIKINEQTNEVQQKLLESSIYVLSSKIEGFPMVLAEAGECALPLVAYNCCSAIPKLIINNYNGFVVEPNSSYKHLSEAICKLIEDEDLRKKMSVNARLHAKEFDLDNIMGIWQSFFVKCVKK